MKYKIFSFILIVGIIAGFAFLFFKGDSKVAADKVAKAIENSTLAEAYKTTTTNSAEFQKSVDDSYQRSLEIVSEEK